MEEFLNDYVQAAAEEKGVKLTPDELHNIVNSLLCCDVIWEILDEHINYEFEERECL